MNDMPAPHRGRRPTPLAEAIDAQNVVVAKNIEHLFVGHWKKNEKDVASQIIMRLEDKRALFNDYAFEVPEHVVRSILDIRQFLTDKLLEVSDEEGLAKHIRAMRAACRKFLDSSAQFSGGPVI